MAKQFALKLKELRENAHLSQKALSLKLGVSQSTVGMWESGRREPSFDTAKKIADFFGVTTDCLLGRRAIEYFPSEDIVYMEVIGSVKAGFDGLACEEHTGDMTPIPTAFLEGGVKSDYFLLRISGNSMYPKMLDGDLVLVKRASSVDSGTVAVVLYGGGEATVKTVSYAKWARWLDLVPANPEYETKHLEGAELDGCRILGRVVKLIRDM